MLWLQLGRDRLPLRQGETTLGRSHYCTIVLQSARSSREHAAIKVDGERITIADLGSLNGTVVNGHRITEAVSLKVGDLITIGSQQIALIESALSDDSASTVEGESPRSRPGTKTLPDV
jgi:pSer/pThr/pTyr-binding forkhead associated (FHA) protein